MKKQIECNQMPGESQPIAADCEDTGHVSISNKYQWVIDKFKEKLPGCSIHTDIGQYGSSFAICVSHAGKRMSFICEALKTIGGTPFKNIDENTGEEFADIGPPFDNVKVGLPGNDNKFKIVDDWISIYT